MSPTYGKVGSEQPVASFIDSVNFTQCSAAPEAIYAVLLAPSGVIKIWQLFLLKDIIILTSAYFLNFPSNVF